MSRLFSHVEFLHSLVVMETVLDDEIDRLESEYDWDCQKMIYLQALDCDRSHLVKMEEKIWKCQELIKVYRKLLQDTFDEKLMLLEQVNLQHQKFLEMSNTNNCTTRHLDTVNMYSCHHQTDEMSLCQYLSNHAPPCQCLADNLSPCPHKLSPKHTNHCVKPLKHRDEMSNCLLGIKTFYVNKLTLPRDHRQGRIINSMRRRNYIQCRSKKYHHRHRPIYTKTRGLKYSIRLSRQQKSGQEKVTQEQKSPNKYKGCNCLQKDLFPINIHLSSNIFTNRQVDLYRLDHPRAEPMSLEDEDQWRRQEMETDNRFDQSCLRCNNSGSSLDEFLFNGERD